jgi:hypothetical protein
MKLDYAGTETGTVGKDDSRPGLGSFVLSLVVVVPFIAGLMAVILGVIALDARSGTRDRGLGIAGLIIGFLNLTLWTMVVLYPVGY